MEYSRYLPILNLLVWSQLTYFNPGEAWGDPERMDVRLLWGAEKLREELQRKIRVNCGFDMSGHAPLSFHKLGMAFDCTIECLEGEDLYSLYTALLSLWPGGVGVYPYWNTPGFHFDIGTPRTWVRDKEGNYYSEPDKIKDIVIVSELHSIRQAKG